MPLHRQAAAARAAPRPSAPPEAQLSGVNGCEVVDGPGRQRDDDTREVPPGRPQRGGEALRQVDGRRPIHVGEVERSRHYGDCGADEHPGPRPLEGLPPSAAFEELDEGNQQGHAEEGGLGEEGCSKGHQAALPAVDAIERERKNSERDPQGVLQVGQPRDRLHPQRVDGPQQGRDDARGARHPESLQRQRHERDGDGQQQNLDEVRDRQRGVQHPEQHVGRVRQRVPRAVEGAGEGSNHSGEAERGEGIVGDVVRIVPVGEAVADGGHIEHQRAHSEGSQEPELAGGPCRGGHSPGLGGFPFACAHDVEKGREEPPHRSSHACSALASRTSRNQHTYRRCARPDTGSWLAPSRSPATARQLRPRSPAPRRTPITWEGGHARWTASPHCPRRGTAS